jgi:hypothetical protein
MMDFLIKLFKGNQGGLRFFPTLAKRIFDWICNHSIDMSFRIHR